MHMHMMGNLNSKWRFILSKLPLSHLSQNISNSMKKNGLNCENELKMMDGSMFIMNFSMTKEMRSLQNEYQSFLRSNSVLVPSILDDSDWMKLLMMKRRSQRMEYYKYLWKKEKGLLRGDERTFNKSSSREYTSHIIDVENCKKDIFYKNNLCHAVMFGQDIIIDLNYTEHMKRHEQWRCIGLLKQLHIHNMRSKDPFHIHFCNASPTNIMTRKINLALPILTESSLMTVTSKNYLDIFPKENLVYLTPDTDCDLDYNPDDVYIIGAFVERRKKKPISLNKAQEDQIRTARLPLKKYLGNDVRLKTLTLDEVMRILLIVKDTHNWKKAFEEIPEFKL